MPQPTRVRVSPCNTGADCSWWACFVQALFTHTSWSATLPQRAHESLPFPSVWFATVASGPVILSLWHDSSTFIIHGLVFAFTFLTDGMPPELEVELPAPLPAISDESLRQSVFDPASVPTELLSRHSHLCPFCRDSTSPFPLLTLHPPRLPSSSLPP